MATERWFRVHGGNRSGPLAFPRLLESVLVEEDPRAVLVWRKGFADWTRAEDVPEIEQRIVSVRDRTLTGGGAGPRGAVMVAPAADRSTSKAPSPKIVGARRVLALVAAVGLPALFTWWLWPRPQVAALPSTSAVGSGGGGSVLTTAPPAPPVHEARPVRAGDAARPPAVETSPGSAERHTPVAGIADRERELPAQELRKLRGVAGWSGDRLTLTVYNGTAWRVTELSVRIGRFTGEDFVEDARAVRLVPPAGEVDAGVADLLRRVAPDRKRPGLNPLDTGPFQGSVGVRPESFRWEIETARGYPPRG